ncbi:OLC1v1012296C3 [Oldenlandia corymbosa var. corymbosa]|uniref:OLC1v1012296C3 n=1 Tax=Oldenlandia corymbosa var. corymbosa TaxID=529605 RepID=A0AAV1DYU5_OLDCO|nr:OLC1v1012296C3 [Oldenlandia corymbosa var. corymbosa]
MIFKRGALQWKSLIQTKIYAAKAAEFMAGTLSCRRQLGPLVRLVAGFELISFSNVRLEKEFNFCFLSAPNVVGQEAGLILGSTALGRREGYQKFLFPAATQDTLGAFCAFGYLLFEFLSGVKMNTGMMRKTGSKALAIGIINLVVPLAVGWFTLKSLSIYPPKKGSDVTPSLQNNVSVLKASSMTAFPVVALLLKDLKILNSELGRLALSCALITHMLQLIYNSTSLLHRIYLSDHGRAVSDVMVCISFILLVIFLLRPAFIWVVKQTPEGRPVKDLYLFLTILLALVSAVISYWFELAVLFGPFIIGLAVPEGPPLGSALVDKLDALSSGVILPTFISLVALRADLSQLSYYVPHIALIVATFSSKVISCCFVGLYCKMPLNDAVALGLILSIKGVVDLGAYSFLRDANMIDQSTFTLLVVYTAIVATLVPSMVQLLYDPNRKYAGYQKRSIMHSKIGGKLPVLACIHSSDNITAIIGLLDAYTPSLENPITVNALHLIELRGRASPIFISHQLQKKPHSRDDSYSENVIFAFKQFERNNRGSVSLQVFTAISPRKLMHEDISTLALNVLASIIVLPFHRRWAIDRSVESEDISLRMLNRSVLERAPCSVGILVDRGHVGPSTSMMSSGKKYSISAIFLGGNDCQEVLALAKRMTKHRNISLTVMRFISTKTKRQNFEAEMEDIKALHDFKQSRWIGQGNNVAYMERVLKDSSEFAWTLRSLADEYDLILVGRCYKVKSSLTSGFEEWCDVPELGAIGEFLASRDLQCRASVFIVQQQKITH